MIQDPYRIVGPMVWEVTGGKIQPSSDFLHKRHREAEIKAIRAKFADLKRRVRGGK